MHECIKTKIIQVTGEGIILDCKKNTRKDISLNFCPFCGAQINFSSPKAEYEESDEDEDEYKEFGRVLLARHGAI